MADPNDPLNPEAWHKEPNVCGSCIAWRPADSNPAGADVASGVCRLRSELPRVPANMAKCDLYKPRGGFVYTPEAPKPTKRRRAAAAKVMRRTADGKMVSEVVAAPKKRAPARPRVSKADREGSRVDGDALLNYVPPPPPKYRPFPPPEHPLPDRVELGSESIPEIKGALVEMLQAEFPRSGRELAPKFSRGGKVIIENGERKKEHPAYKVFEQLDKLRHTLDYLEKAVAKTDKLTDEKDELVTLVKKVKGSFTTFNVMFSHREDYFTSK